jgi:FlaA1/EpsC-like NDP-sugar epimerase
MEILITGGTGTLGKELIKYIKTNFNPHGIRVFSRDEFKQWNLKNELISSGMDEGVAFLLGDVRDAGRMERAMKGVDVVFHTAAMKQVPACEYNPLESIKTNIDGTVNVINSAINNQVKLVMHVSTDKAVYPINIYGACKAVAEKLIIHGNVYGKTKLCCCRYGNVLNSRGSVIPLFRKQYLENGKKITLTAREMTRFFITIEEVVKFIVDRSLLAAGGEIFVPDMKSMRMSTLIEWMFPDAKIEVIGVRQGEKLHECLITAEEMSRVFEFHDGFFEISPPTEYDVRTTAFGGMYSNGCPEWERDQFMEVIKNYGNN